MNIEIVQQKILEEIADYDFYGIPFILAIDGRCASGKSTFANKLSALTGATVIHADDFFLQPFQRTEKRLETPGENVDWERIKTQVLMPLSRGETAYYRPFHCHTMSFGKELSAAPVKAVIVEGTYSLNKELAEFYSSSVFMTVSPKIQLERIAARNGREGAEMFKKKWIPLEEKYFSAYDLQNRCKYVVNTD